MSEAKYGTNYNVTNVPNNGMTTININPNFPQGVDKDERIGNRIKYKSLRLEFHSAAVAAGNNINGVAGVRILLVQLRLPLNTVPSQVDFFLDAQWCSPIRHEAVRVLWDKFIYLQVFNAVVVPVTTNIPATYHKRLRRKIRNNVGFASSAALTPTDPKDLYRLIIVTNSQTANDYTVIMNWGFKISFIDI